MVCFDPEASSSIFRLPNFGFGAHPFAMARVRGQIVTDFLEVAGARRESALLAVLEDLPVGLIGRDVGGAIGLGPQSVFFRSGFLMSLDARLGDLILDFVDSPTLQTSAPFEGWVMLPRADESSDAWDVRVDQILLDVFPVSVVPVVARIDPLASDLVFPVEMRRDVDALLRVFFPGNELRVTSEGFFVATSADGYPNKRFQLKLQLEIMPRLCSKLST